jgi:hypothetical protein
MQEKEPNREESKVAPILKWVPPTPDVGDEWNCSKFPDHVRRVSRPEVNVPVDHHSELPADPFREPLGEVGPAGEADQPTP